MNDSDFAWLIEHGGELLKEHAGKWIAVAKGKVVGIGDTAPEAADLARQQDPECRFVLEHVPREVDTINARS